MFPSRLASTVVLVALVALLAACHATPATSGGGVRKAPAPSLTLAARQTAARVTLEIRWKGIPAPAVLLVDIDSQLEATRRAQPVRAEGVELHGLVLAARVHGTGSTKLSLDRARLAAFLDDRTVIVTARVPLVATAEVLAGDPTVMGGQHVERIEPVRPDEFTAKFRIVRSGSTDDVAKIFAPESLEGVPDHRKLIAGSAEIAGSARVLVRLK